MSKITWFEVPHAQFGEEFWNLKYEYWTESDRTDIHFERWFIGKRGGNAVVFAVHSDDELSSFIYDNESKGERAANAVLICSLAGWDDAWLYWDAVTDDDVSLAIIELTGRLVKPCYDKLVGDKARADAEDAA